MAAPTRAAKGLKNHHIIPIYAGGNPNASWNLIALTAEEHYLAHYLRAQTFSKSGGRLACRFTSAIGLSAEKQKELSQKRAHETARQKKVGWFDSNQQSIKGVKGGAVQTVAKVAMHRKKMGALIMHHLSTKVTWQHKSLNCTIIIEPNTFALLTQLVPLFMKTLSKHNQVLSPLCSSNLERLNGNLGKLKTQSIAHVTSLIARVIKKERKLCYGWFIVEPNLTKDT